MALSRREFAAMLVGAGGGVALPLFFQPWRQSVTDGSGWSGDAAGDPYFRWRPVTDRVWLAEGGGGNSLIYLGRRGALAVDAKSFGLGRSLSREALDRGVLVTHLVLTHHHADHCGGSEAFRGAVRLAHRNAEPRILATAAASLERGEASLSALESRLADSGGATEVVREIRGLSAELHDLTPRDFGPTVTFDEGYEIDLGGPPVELRWASQGHTDGDAFLYLPEENVLHCGDLVFQGRHPYVDVGAGATPRGWIRCLEAMLEYCDADTVVVPGHGGVTDRGGLTTQADYFRRLQAIVERGRVEGRNREEIQGMNSEDFRELDGGNEHLARNLGLVYDESVMVPSPKAMESLESEPG